MTVATPFPTAEQYLDAVTRAAEAARAYYEGDGTITMDDATYDQLVRDIVATEQTHPQWRVDNQLTAVAAGTGGGDVPHSIPMLSLDNVFSGAELDEWATSLAKRLGRPADGFTIEPKMDGLAISARYVDGRLTQLVTRGDGTSGEDVTYAARTIVGLPSTLPRPLTFEARGEVLLTDAQFAAANELRIAHGDKAFVNPRNGAAGTLRGAKDRQYDIALTFFGYGVVDLDGTVFPADERHSVSMSKLADLGISTTGTSSAGMGQVADIGQAHAWIDDLIERRPTLGFAIDGAVIKADSPADRDKAGFSSRAPRWGIARKFPADTAISKLIAVHWQLGRTGLITPRAEIEPVMVGGTTVTFATLHSPGDILKKGFLLGDAVTVLRAGEVIPRLEAPLVNLRTGAETVIEPPTSCPRCGADIDKSQERWRCSRGRACGLGESIKYAVSRDCLDLEGMGEKVVSQLVETGLVADVADLFTLTKAQLLSLDRMGSLSADKLLAEIEKAKGAPFARVLTALGIRGTGRSMSRRLAKHFGSMDALRAATANELEAVDGIGPEKSPSIVAELAELGPVIDRLAALGVTMGEEPTTAGAPAAGETSAAPLAGMAVVVTGAMTGPLAALSRNEMNELIERAGGRASGSVSAKTSLLVAGDKAGSKRDKALSLGVPVNTPEEFAETVAAYL